MASRGVRAESQVAFSPTGKWRAKRAVAATAVLPDPVRLWNRPPVADQIQQMAWTDIGTSLMVLSNSLSVSPRRPVIICISSAISPAHTPHLLISLRQRATRIYGMYGQPKACIRTRQSTTLKPCQQLRGRPWASPLQEIPPMHACEILTLRNSASHQIQGHHPQ